MGAEVWSCTEKTCSFLGTLENVLIFPFMLFFQTHYSRSSRRWGSTKVSRFRRLMRRAPTSKYNKLTDIKQKARELGWQTKGESDDESHDSDSDSMEPCWKLYGFFTTIFHNLIGNALKFFVVPILFGNFITPLIHISVWPARSLGG